MPRRFAVLGSPIAHSKSPQIHRAAFEALGVEWTYTRYRVEADELHGFLAEHGAVEGWHGFSVTMPLKERAFELSTAHCEHATLSGVVNTLVRSDDGWSGFNTDIAGLRMALELRGFDLTHTVVLGAGATATSAVLAARAGGAQRITVVARRAAAASALAGRFDCSAHPTDAANPINEPTTVISTLPGSAGAEAEIPAELFEVPLFDVAYDPWPSPLSRRWGSSRTVGGQDMLVCQALFQERIFVQGAPGSPLPDEERVFAAMRAAVGRSLEEERMGE